MNRLGQSLVAIRVFEFGPAEPVHVEDGLTTTDVIILPCHELGPSGLSNESLVLTKSLSFHCPPGSLPRIQAGKCEKGKGRVGLANLSDIRGAVRGLRCGGVNGRDETYFIGCFGGCLPVHRRDGTTLRGGRPPSGRNLCPRTIRFHRFW